MDLTRASTRSSCGPAPVRTSAVALLVLVGGIAAAMHGPPPGPVLTVLAHPSAGINRLGLDGVTAVLGGAMAWLVLLWLLVAVGIALVAELPTRLGRVAAAVAAVAVPATARRAIAVTIGVGTVTGGFTGVAGAATVSPGHSVAATVPAPVYSGTPDLDWPTAPPHHRGDPEASPPRTHAGHHATVRVRPGDSLWAITADDLGPHASASAVGAGWRQLYRANRDVIGNDPDLIRPGQQLRTPYDG